MFFAAIKDLKRQIKELRKKQFRVGDKVYIQDGHKHPLTPYYLIKPYNNGNCYYVSQVKDDKSVKEVMGNGANIIHMSHEKPLTCHCCGNLLAQPKESE